MFHKQSKDDLCVIDKVMSHCCDTFECESDVKEESNVSDQYQANMKQILDMVAEGTITSAQAAELIAALGQKEPTDSSPLTPSKIIVNKNFNSDSSSGTVKKKIRIKVQCHDSKKNKDVNIAVPLGLASAAFGCIPKRVSDELKCEGINLEEMRDRLRDGCCDIDGPLLNIDSETASVQIVLE